MLADTRRRIRLHGPPVSASRKAKPKKTSGKKTSGSAKKGSRRKRVVSRKKAGSAKRKGTRQTQSRSKKKVARAKRQPTRTRTKSPAKKSARVSKSGKKTAKKRKSTRTAGSKKGAKRPAKKSGSTRKSTGSKRKKVSRSTRARKPKSQKRKRKSAAVAKPAKKRRAVHPTTAKKPVPAKAKPRVKKPRVRGEVLRPEPPITHIRGEKLSAEEVRRPGSALIPHLLAPNVYYVDISKFEDYAEVVGDDEDEPERYTTSTSGMHPFNDNYLQLFKQAFFDYTKKTRFEDMDDVPIFRYGLVIRSVRPRSGEEVKELVYQFADFLKDMLPRGASAHIVDEDKYISVRLGLGRYQKPTTFSQAYEYMKRNKELIWNFKRGALDYLEDMVWFEFWDTEENYAES